MREEQPFQRLKTARETAGYKSASDAARRIGAKIVTYTAHKNGGREFDRVAALQYAEKFGVDPAWLMFGDRGKTTQAVLRSVKAPHFKTTTPMADRADYLPPGFNVGWELPEEFYEKRLEISVGRSRLLEVRGDSMYDPANPSAPGSLYPGERVIADLDDVTPTPPGVFVIFDGAGPVIKILEVIPYSKPQTLRLSSRNPRYPVQECPMDVVSILGRVKAKVSMLI